MAGRSEFLVVHRYVVICCAFPHAPALYTRRLKALSAWKQVAMKTGNDRHLTQCNSIQTSSRCQCAALMSHIHVTFSFLIEKLIEMDNLEVSYFRP